jgi:hypothetical protein
MKVANTLAYYGTDKITTKKKIYDPLGAYPCGTLKRLIAFTSNIDLRRSD